MSGLTREMLSRLLTSLLVSSLSVVVLFGSLVFWSLVAPLAGVFWYTCHYSGTFGWCIGTLWSLVAFFGQIVHLWHWLVYCGSHSLVSCGSFLITSGTLWSHVVHLGH